MGAAGSHNPSAQHRQTKGSIWLYPFCLQSPVRPCCLVITADVMPRGGLWGSQEVEKSIVSTKEDLAGLLGVFGARKRSGMVTLQ